MTLSIPSRSIPAPQLRAATRLAPGAVTWTTVAVLAVLMAYADGFVVTSIRGAVGAIERTQGPFLSWLRESTVMTPVFLLAVLGALAFARRRFGPVLRSPRKVVAAALLIAVAGGLVGTGQVVVSAAYDYHLQSEQLLVMARTHHHEATTAAAAVPGACTGTCASQQQQLVVDERAARLGSALVLGTNLVLVLWVLAFRGGRLETERPGSGRRRPAAGTGAGALT
jgi:hypothetical protein